MPNLIDKIFPDEQCLSEETMQLVEHITGEDIVNFFRVIGPVIYGRKDSQVHAQSPFTLTYSELQQFGINYDALYRMPLELADIRLKLLDNEIPE